MKKTKKKATKVFPSRWTRTPESRQGRSQDRPDVRTPIYVWENGKVVAKKP